MLVVRNDASNRVADTVTILQITSNVSRVYPFEVLLELEEGGLPKSSKVQTHQIWTISKQRISGGMPGSLSEEKMQFVDAAIRLHLVL